MEGRHDENGSGEYVHRNTIDEGSLSKAPPLAIQPLWHLPLRNEGIMKLHIDLMPEGMLSQDTWMYNFQENLQALLQDFVRETDTRVMKVHNLGTGVKLDIAHQDALTAKQVYWLYNRYNVIWFNVGKTSVTFERHKTYEELGLRIIRGEDA